MKKLSDILLEANKIAEEVAAVNSNTIVPPVTVQTTDRVGAALDKLDQIGEMANDLYNTISHLEEVDAETDAALTGAYNSIDDLYAKIDDKYDVIPVDLDEYDEETVEESYESTDLLELLDEAKFTDSIAKDILKKHGFYKIDTDQIKNYGLPKKIGNPKSVYGIPVPPSKVTDLFFIFLADGSYAIFDYDDLLIFRNANDAINRIKKMMKESYDLEEALSADDEASEWISDFVKSDAPQFKGKSKKERIKMALAAYYSAQKKESADLTEGVLDIIKKAGFVDMPLRDDPFPAPHAAKKWGIKMRAGKWADTVIGQYKDNSLHSWFIYTNDELQKYGSDEMFVKALKKMALGEEFELEESVNLPKIKELVSLALIDEKDVPATVAALKATQSDKALTPAQTKLLGNLAVMLTNVILGDTSALSSVKRASKE